VRHHLISPVLAAIFAVAGNGDEIVLDRQALHAQAVAESLIPIRPGIPGKVPFWNVNASRFIYVPSFDFKPVQGAVSYRFTATAEADDTTHSFEASQPWAILKPIWKDLPVGYVTLRVEGIDPRGTVVGLAGARRFYRAAVFNGPYHRPATDYRESALRGLRYLFRTGHFQRWKREGTPDPGYFLYCYPSKMVAAVIRGMLLYARLAPEDSEDALRIARGAARYLIGVSEPKGAPLEYFPPTYDARYLKLGGDERNTDARFAAQAVARYQGQIMLLYPATVASAYLDLYEKTHEEILFDAAVRIADTYAKIQSADGRWPLVVDSRTGRPVAKNSADPGNILALYRRLIYRYKLEGYRRNLRLAERTVTRPFEEFNFEGQFEDVAPSKRYANLSHWPAIGAARYFFDRAKQDPANLARAEEYLRFAEDQFVVWERPIPRPRPGRTEVSDGWITPCALEQYRCYRPVDASASGFVSIFYRAYRVTGKKLYLAKAISLANAITIAQDPATGRYPTWWLPARIAEAGWINCAIADAAALDLFGKQVARHKFLY